MDRRIFGVFSMVLVFLIAGGFPLQAQSPDAKALLEEAAKAMGGEYGRLISVRLFFGKNGGPTIEPFVGCEKAIFSTVIRLDDPEAVADLFNVLDSLHGHSLKEILRLKKSDSSTARRFSPRQPQSHIFQRRPWNYG